MWFLLLAAGAVAVQLAGGPLGRRLPVPPPPESLLAAWFLLAALARLLVLRSRLAAQERAARRLARRAADQGTSPLGELGLGVGRGALQVVGGDVMGASLSLVAGLLRGAAGSLKPDPAPRKERRRAALRERLAAAACVLGVGLTCMALAWWPLVGHHATRAAAPALRAAGLVPPPPPARPVDQDPGRRATIAAPPPAPAPARAAVQKGPP
jgi:hypothetical protein